MIKMDLTEEKTDAKMDFMDIVGDLMPGGKPTYLDVIRFPTIKNWVAELGKKAMLKVLYLLVKDFCRSVNVVRNMNEDQMIESAAMLIDECDNFRLEDYAMHGQKRRTGKNYGSTGYFSNKSDVR